MSLRLFALLACLGVSAAAATTLTVHNHTGSTLQVTRLWGPWRPEPDDGPMAIPFFRRLIKPGAVGSYAFPFPGKDLESTIIINHLPGDGVVEFENMIIQAAPSCEEPTPDPEAPELRSKL